MKPASSLMDSSCLLGSRGSKAFWVVFVSTGFAGLDVLVRVESLRLRLPSTLIALGFR